MPAIVRPEKVKTLLLVIPQLVPVIVIVPVGIKLCEALTVNVPEILKLALDCEEGVPSTVSPLKVSIPLLVMPQEVPVIVTVPFDGAKPEPVLALLVKVPAILKLVVVCVLGVVAIVMPVKVKAVPLLVIFQPVPVKVIVPVGINDCEAFTVSNPEMEKLALGWLDGVPAIVKPLNVSATELPKLNVQPVPDIVIVPPVGAKVLLAAIVRAPVTE